MKKFFTILSISSIILLCVESVPLKAAAEPQEEESLSWESVEAKSLMDAWIILNFSPFPIALDYVPFGTTNKITAYLPGNSAPGSFHTVISPQNMRSGAQIRISTQDLDKLKLSLAKLSPSALSRMLSAYMKNALEPIFSIAGPSMLANLTEPLARYIFLQKIAIEPKQYKSGAFLAFYWPLFLALLYQPPTIVPLSDFAAIEFWVQNKNILDEAIQTSPWGAEKAYNMFRNIIEDYEWRKISLNAERLSNLIRTIKMGPAFRPQPLKEGIISEYVYERSPSPAHYEAFEEYLQP